MSEEQAKYTTEREQAEAKAREQADRAECLDNLLLKVSRDRDTLAVELDRLRVKNSELHRRAQRAESIIEQSGIVENRPMHGEGRSMGRALANFAAAKAERELAEARGTCGEQADTILALRQEIEEATELAKLKAQIERDFPPEPEYTAWVEAGKPDADKLRTALEDACELARDAVARAVGDTRVAAWEGRLDQLEDIAGIDK